LSVAVSQDQLYATLALELSWSGRGRAIPQLAEVLLDRYLPPGVARHHSPA
jgi:hypothetical protein